MFVRSGFVYIGSNMSNASQSGYLWSSTAYDYDRSIFLGLYVTSVGAVGNYQKSLAFPLRCLSTVLDI